MERFQIQNCIDWNRSQRDWAQSQIQRGGPAGEEAERNARRHQANIEKLNFQLAEMP
jgi:hypothetical protein